MTKIELAGYLADLSFIMDHHEKLGTTKNPVIVAEFVRCHEALVQLIKEENSNEARKRKLIEDGRNKTTYGVSQRESGWSSPDRKSNVERI